MKMSEAAEAASHFRIGAIKGMHEISSGHINATYRVDAADGSYLLQRVNTAVFREPEKMMENIAMVLERIPALRLIEAYDGRFFHEDGSGFFRMYNFIEDSVSYDKVDSEAMAYRMGRALGLFHRALAPVDGACLHETIPHFHDLSFRNMEFEKALAEDRAGRRGSVSREVGFIRSCMEEAGRISSLYNEGLLPKRVTHNDAKLQNILFSRTTGEYLTFVDLDTVMPGTVLFDTGDMIRTGCSSAAEDEPDLGRVRFSDPFFQAVREGYLSCADALRPEETALFAESGFAITFIMALRFLTDYLNGDAYYRISYPEHNLVRARNQMKLIEDMRRFI